MVLSVLWLLNEPVREIEFRWDEVESMARVAWFWFSRDIKFRLRRGVVENNRRRSFYFCTWNLKGEYSRILDFAGARGVRVVPETERFVFWWVGEWPGERPGTRVRSKYKQIVR